VFYNFWEEKMTKFEYVEGSYVKKWFPEAASQSFKKGQHVYLSSSGLVTACADNEIKVIGVSDADASGTTNNWIPVILALDDTVFAGSSTNAGADVTLAVTYIGKNYAVYVSSNTVLVDLGDTTNDLVHTVGVHPDCIPASASVTLANSTNGKVLFRFLAANSQAMSLEVS